MYSCLCHPIYCLTIVVYSCRLQRIIICHQSEQFIYFLCSRARPHHIEIDFRVSQQGQCNLNIIWGSIWIILWKRIFKTYLPTINHFLTLVRYFIFKIMIHVEVIKEKLFKEVCTYVPMYTYLPKYLLCNWKIKKRI